MNKQTQTHQLVEVGLLSPQPYRQRKPLRDFPCVRPHEVESDHLRSRVCRGGWGVVGRGRGGGGEIGQLKIITPVGYHQQQPYHIVTVFSPDPTGKTPHTLHIYNYIHAGHYLSLSDNSGRDVGCESCTYCRYIASRTKHTQGRLETRNTNRNTTSSNHHGATAAAAVSAWYHSKRKKFGHAAPTSVGLALLV